MEMQAIFVEPPLKLDDNRRVRTDSRRVRNCVGFAYHVSDNLKICLTMGGPCRSFKVLDRLAILVLSRIRPYPLSRLGAVHTHSQEIITGQLHLPDAVRGQTC